MLSVWMTNHGDSFAYDKEGKVKGHSEFGVVGASETAPTILLTPNCSKPIIFTPDLQNTIGEKYMLKRFLSIMLICLLSFLTCVAQTNTATPRELAKQTAKLTRAELLKPQPSKPDYQKNAYKQEKEKDGLSKTDKALLWGSIIVVAAVVTGLLIWQGGKIKTGSTTIITTP
jgi:hypothetical protein